MVALGGWPISYERGTPAARMHANPEVQQPVISHMGMDLQIVFQTYLTKDYAEPELVLRCVRVPGNGHVAPDIFGAQPQVVNRPLHRL